MIIGQLRGKVGVAPSTTTLLIPRGLSGMGQEVFVCNGAETAPSMTMEEYLATDIAMRRQAAEQQRRSVFWDRLGTFATASLAPLALVASISAWFRTGRIEAVRK
jgi:hypothetical protein